MLTSLVRSARLSAPSLSASVLGTALLSAALLSMAGAQEPPLGATNVQQVQGRVEMQSASQVWRPITAASPLEAGLRTGTGRAMLTNPQGGRVTVGGASTLRTYSHETDFLRGSFVLDGPVSAFALGNHFSVERGSRVRVDVDNSTRRLAVLKGNLRFSANGRNSQLAEGQQIDLSSLRLGNYRETDPWYDSQFIGAGRATLEAMRGNVQIREAEGGVSNGALGRVLEEGDTLQTGAGSWAEVGFTGGGYLRLTELGELKVLSVEKTTRGREVLLQLTKGSAWNVVEKGQGGYKIVTPVVSTAVRGTKYRVDANGLVKVVEGSVEVPSVSQTTLQAGQQQANGGAIVPLTSDAIDLLNQQLDEQHNLPMSLIVDVPARQVATLRLGIETLSDTMVTVTATPKAQAGTQAGGSTQLVAAPRSTEEAVWQWAVTEPEGAALPEGVYTVQVRATRFKETRVWQGDLRIDRTPPTLKVQRRTVGRVTVVSGQVSDNAPLPLKLSLHSHTAQAQYFVRPDVNEGRFELLLPAPNWQGDLKVHLEDGAGNGVDAQLR